MSNRKSLTEIQKIFSGPLAGAPLIQNLVLHRVLHAKEPVETAVERVLKNSVRECAEKRESIRTQKAIFHLGEAALDAQVATLHRIAKAQNLEHLTATL